MVQEHLLNKQSEHIVTIPNRTAVHQVTPRVVTTSPNLAAHLFIQAHVTLWCDRHFNLVEPVRDVQS